MTSVPHSGAKSVTPGGSVAGGHTKGPWVVTSDGYYVLPAADLTKIVALVFRPDADSETERLDNARLIAAAPDLLSVAKLALKTILDEAEARDFDPPADTNLVAELEASITRATGDRPEKGEQQ